MNRLLSLIGVAAAAAAIAGCATQPAPAPATGGVVKVTPLGGFDGEFCAQDRALVFEDPNGTRVLYDPGRTVMGGSDPRLGKIDVILVTHTHGDHLGNAHQNAMGAGTCAAPDSSVSAMPNSNAVNIVFVLLFLFVFGCVLFGFFVVLLCVFCFFCDADDRE